MSLTATLSTAITGLNLAQRALSVTANNVANANTDGYSRKEIRPQEIVLSGDGRGVTDAGTRRIVDDYLNAELRTQQGRLAQQLGGLRHVGPRPGQRLRRPRRQQLGPRRSDPAAGERHGSLRRLAGGDADANRGSDGPLGVRRSIERQRRCGAERPPGSGPAHQLRRSLGQCRPAVPEGRERRAVPRPLLAGPAGPARRADRRSRQAARRDGGGERWRAGRHLYRRRYHAPAKRLRARWCIPQRPW